MSEKRNEKKIQRYLEKAEDHLEQALHYLKKAEATKLVNTVSGIIKEITDVLEKEG